MTFELPRSQRLTRRADFLRIQQEGQRVTTKHFVLIVAPGPDPLAPPRLGITASRQVGNSVTRARCKRLVREVFRRDRGWLPPGVDLVVIVRSSAQALGYAGVEAEWSSVRGVLARRAATLRKRPPPLGEAPLR
ncbi:MAG: ribonuclease P protein component [Myxococcales bacterium]|nr:ribonuclease P protein component [Polyangiaceae bacterium]MDW8249100.1 ribonuclease P protein component [Myxococcales bacterium]